GGADYCGVGAMFTTSLKPDREPSGVAYLREFIAAHPRTPHLAIGGITPERVPALVDAGCRGVAVSAAICGAADPGETAARIVASLGSSTASASTRASDAGPFAARDESAETRAASDRECRA
ncbi:MAG: hypothetical protein FJ253_02785, partial [Phycisphaerae bacterium]|nr:hypothetical protein [Phycisphaerae bacterium]